MSDKFLEVVKEFSDQLYANAHNPIFIYKMKKKIAAARNKSPNSFSNKLFDKLNNLLK